MSPSRRKTRRCSRVIGGVDWGYTNPTAAAVFGSISDERVWQLDEFYQRRAPLDAVVIPALLELTRRYNVRVWYCGPDEPEHIARARRRPRRARDLPAARVNGRQRRPPGHPDHHPLLARREDGTRGLYVSPRCVHTIAEYGSYQYPTAERAGRDPDEQPLKPNDHALDATRYSLHTPPHPPACRQIPPRRHQRAPGAACHA